jgi:hypothetical protein
MKTKKSFRKVRNFKKIEEEAKKIYEDQKASYKEQLSQIRSDKWEKIGKVGFGELSVNGVKWRSIRKA